MIKIKYLIVLAVLVSFGMIGAVTFTPGLPEIASYFSISNLLARDTVTWYLIGTAFGQLLYGPLANRFGSRKTIAIGCLIEIFGASCCILAFPLHAFWLLIIARYIMALGAASGYHMTFTIASKLFTHQEHIRALSLLNMAFAVMPTVGVFIGGILVSHFNWTAPFYFMIIYGVLVILCSRIIPEVYVIKDYTALAIKNILSNYLIQVRNKKIILGGLLIGIGTSAIYIFAAASPFIAINIMHLTPYSYGIYNLIPCLGILLGSFWASHLSKMKTTCQALKLGLGVALIGALIFIGVVYFYPETPFSLFIPPVILYTGLSFLFSNAATISLYSVKDKSNAAAVMSFINVISAFINLTILSLFIISKPIILPIIYLLLVGMGILWGSFLINSTQNNKT